jgi:hypothetical protein
VAASEKAVSSTDEANPPEPGRDERPFRRRGLATVAIALTALLGVWAFRGLPLRTELTDFVPESEDTELAAIAREVTDSEIARTTLLSLGQKIN